MHNDDRILRRPEVERACGLKRSAIYAAIAEGTFPGPVPLGPRAVGWLESEIRAWLRERIAERGQLPARQPEPEMTARHSAAISRAATKRRASSGAKPSTLEGEGGRVTDGHK